MQVVLLQNTLGNLFQNLIQTGIIVYRTRANKWRSRSVAAPLRIHAKSNFLPHFYVTI